MAAVGPTAPVSRAASGPAPARRGPGGFGLPGQGAPAVSGTAASAEVSLATLLAMQDEAESVEDREARRHAQDLLAELDGLHRALLGRPGGADHLGRLATLCDATPAMARDPRLAEAVAAVRLRARVERARYGLPPDQ